MRIRLIHPEFFTDSTLAELSDFARLVFIGLWLIADREGRLSDSVKMIDGQILPLDQRSSGPALDELATAGRIRRYRSEAGPVIEVTNFLKYQHIHPKEKASRFPGPNMGGAPGQINGAAPGQNGTRTRKGADQNLIPHRKRRDKVGNRNRLSTSSSTSTSTSRAAREESAPKARASDPRDGGDRDLPRRVAADAPASRGASAPVGRAHVVDDDAVVKKYFG